MVVVVVAVVVWLLLLPSLLMLLLPTVETAAGVASVAAWVRAVRPAVAARGAGGEAAAGHCPEGFRSQAAGLWWRLRLRPTSGQRRRSSAVRCRTA